SGLTTNPLAASPEGLTTGPFSVECLNAASVLTSGVLALVLQVKCGEDPVHGAELMLRVVVGQETARYCYATTDGGGVAKVSLATDYAEGQEGRGLVQATRDDVSGTRRFRLHPAG